MRARRRLTNGLLAASAIAAGSMLVGPPAPFAAGSATTTTERSRQVDVNPGEQNPCNGSTGTITDDEQDVFHITTLDDGTYRFAGHSTVQVTFEPDDSSLPSYAGHETFMIAEASTSQAFTTTSRERVRIKGTDGSFLTFAELVHYSVSAGGVSVLFDRPTFVCS
jgi:hypothetical protein